MEPSTALPSLPTLSDLIGTCFAWYCAAPCRCLLHTQIVTRFSPPPHPSFPLVRVSQSQPVSAVPVRAYHFIISILLSCSLLCGGVVCDQQQQVNDCDESPAIRHGGCVWGACHSAQSHFSVRWKQGRAMVTGGQPNNMKGVLILSSPRLNKGKDGWVDGKGGKIKF